MLTLTAAQQADMFAHLDAVAPEEGCGLLGGSPDGRVIKVYLVTNELHSPVRYRMAPTELVSALMEIEAHGWELLAIFHSHPGGLAVPSATDIAEAHYPDSAYIICAPLAVGWRARAFTIADRLVSEIPLVVVP